MRRSCAAVVCAAVLGLLTTLAMIVVPAGIASAETLHFAFKGQTATAFFRSLDPTGCVETHASPPGMARVRAEPQGLNSVGR
jgi:hypothetical protein